jgi:hypothetical protein
MQKAHKYLAEPTDLQEFRMQNCPLSNGWCGSLCHPSNESIAERKDSYRNTGKRLASTGQQKALPRKRKKDLALCRVHSQVAHDCLRQLDKVPGYSNSAMGVISNIGGFIY